MFAKVAAAGVAVATVLLGVASSAFAQSTTVVGTSPPAYERKGYLENKVPAPMGAFELSLGAGYTQPFGSVQPGTDFSSVAREGMGVDIGLASRVNPHWSVGIDGQYQELNAQRGTGARGLRAGVDVTYHAAPYARVDPFLTLGIGYRGLRETFPTGVPDRTLHGFELARVNLGLDMRAGQSIAIGPMIGADVNLFLWQQAAGATTTIASPSLNTFVFAGLQGRFDFGGDRVSETAVVPALANR